MLMFCRDSFCELTRVIVLLLVKPRFLLKVTPDV